MRIRRSIRLRITLVALFALLFAQLSVAAYACPSPPGAQPPAAMTDCDGMTSQADSATPNLCAEHCHYGEQSDQPRSPGAPAAALIALYVLPSLPALHEPVSSFHETSDWLIAPSPPHTILHCCFRI